ncbi:MAG: hypothetical protein MUO91_00190 [candidate division Zixibacteria bacterium]|nr:hypothetical protein [candidate division Zixibacteria bacterium]
MTQMRFNPHPTKREIFKKSLTNKKPPAKLNSEEGVKPITLEEGVKGGSIGIFVLASKE